jgi:hypothetical protein
VQTAGRVDRRCASPSRPLLNDDTVGQLDERWSDRSVYVRRGCRLSRLEAVASSPVASARLRLLGLHGLRAGASTSARSPHSPRVPRDRWECPVGLAARLRSPGRSDRVTCSPRRAAGARRQGRRGSPSADVSISCRSRSQTGRVPSLVLGYARRLRQVAGPSGMIFARARVAQLIPPLQRAGSRPAAERQGSSSTQAKQRTPPSSGAGPRSSSRSKTWTGRRRALPLRRPPNATLRVCGRRRFWCADQGIPSNA